MKQLTERHAGKVFEQLAVLSRSPDRLAHYQITKAQADDLCRSVPFLGEPWLIPDHALMVVNDVLATIPPDARRKMF